MSSGPNTHSRAGRPAGSSPDVRPGGQLEAFRRGVAELEALLEDCRRGLAEVDRILAGEVRDA